jgi:hypothetical protein
MASGDSLLYWVPQDNEPPTGNPATPDRRNRHPLLDFDPDTDEFAVFSGVMPQRYLGTTGVTVYLHYSMTSAVAGDVYWGVAFERIGVGQQDLDDDGWGADNSNNETVPGTSGHVSIIAIPFTDGVDMENVVAGEGFRIRVRRDADNPSDNAAGDAELRFVEIRET